ncbi:MAG: ribonuclease T2 [Psychrobacter sp.]
MSVLSKASQQSASQMKRRLTPESTPSFLLSSAPPSRIFPITNIAKRSRFFYRREIEKNCSTGVESAESAKNVGSAKNAKNDVKIVPTLGALMVLQGFMLMPAQAANADKTGQRVLMIEMTPALCNIQPTRTRMRQCLEGYSLTVSGLDMGYGEHCGRGSVPRLTPLQLKVVNRIMPDTAVRSQVWQRYGACSPLSAASYFRQITNYAGSLKLPNELNTGNSYTVSKSRFIGQMTRLNKGMSSNSIDLVCQVGKRRQSVLTDIHVCYEGNDFGTCHSKVDSCGSQFIISGGQ